MKIVTLISDWKLKDPYVSMFKGAILSSIPDVTIVDISHAIPLFDIKQTAFILRSVYSTFPNDSLHIILTASTFSSTEKPICVQYNNHHFLGYDNGIFSILFDTLDELQAFEYSLAEEEASSYLNKLVNMAKWLFNNQLSNFTSPFSNFKMALQQKVIFDENAKKISGQIAYIDSCYNAVTNIPVDKFEEFGQNRAFLATIASSNYLKITKCCDFYNASEEEIYFVKNRLGFIEITMYQSNIAILGNIKIGDKVEIVFN